MGAQAGDLTGMGKRDDVAIGIQIGIGTEIGEKTRNSTPIAIAISTVRMCHNEHDIDSL
jgi:hypothetical protein